jgi:hypothetical protein
MSTVSSTDGAFISNHFKVVFYLKTSNNPFPSTNHKIPLIKKKKKPAQPNRFSQPRNPFFSGCCSISLQI